MPPQVKPNITEAMRDKWINRPASEMNMGLEEWLEFKNLIVSMHVAGVKEPAPHGALPSATEAPTKAARPRHEAGAMNKLEAKYANELEMAKRAGYIQDWRFEPMKLRLARSTFFDVDFIVVTRDGSVELREVKGHWEDDARVKIKVAAKEFPWWKFIGIQWDKELKDWKYEEFRA